MHQTLRSLWELHLTWMRLAIVGNAAGIPDLKATTARLLRDQADIGNAIKRVYGDEVGERLTGLLREHILGATRLLREAKGNGTANEEKLKRAWYANADEIALCLHGANRKVWPLIETRSMMHQHLVLTLIEAGGTLQRRYRESVPHYETVHGAIVQMVESLGSATGARSAQDN